MSIDDGDEKVGYGRPPKATRFTKGRSGNPAGRPKGALNERTLMRDIMAEEVSVKINGELRLMTKREAIERVQVDKALRGDDKGYQRVMTALAEAKTAEETQPADEALCAEEQAVIKFLDEYLCKKKDENGG